VKYRIINIRKDNIEYKINIPTIFGRRPPEFCLEEMPLARDLQENGCAIEVRNNSNKAI